MSEEANSGEVEVAIPEKTAPTAEQTAVDEKLSVHKQSTPRKQTYQERINEMRHKQGEAERLAATAVGEKDELSKVIKELTNHNEKLSESMEKFIAQQNEQSSKVVAIEEQKQQQEVKNTQDSKLKELKELKKQAFEESDFDKMEEYGDKIYELKQEQKEAKKVDVTPNNPAQNDYVNDPAYKDFFTANPWASEDPKKHDAEAFGYAVKVENELIKKPEYKDLDVRLKKVSELVNEKYFTDQSSQSPKPNEKVVSMAESGSPNVTRTQNLSKNTIKLTAEQAETARKFESCGVSMASYAKQLQRIQEAG